MIETSQIILSFSHNVNSGNTKLYSGLTAFGSDCRVGYIKPMLQFCHLFIRITYCTEISVHSDRLFFDATLH
jgi:hypothetical protein